MRRPPIQLTLMNELNAAGTASGRAAANAVSVKRDRMWKSGRDGRIGLDLEMLILLFNFLFYYNYTALFLNSLDECALIMTRLMQS